MNFTEFSLRRPVTTSMIFLSVAVIGIISVKLLPLEFFPSIDVPFIQIEIPYPGSNPEEVEREITRPVEEALATIGDIKYMGSHSDENGSNVWLEFDWGTNTDVKALKAREKIDGVRHLLPEDIERIFVHKFNTDDEEILALRLSSNRDLSNAFDMLNRNLKRRIERINGVSRVTLYGVEENEIQIKLSVDKLATYRVDVGKLVEKLMQSNFSLPSGKIFDGKNRLFVRPVGEFTGVEDYKNIVIGKNNLRIKDVAEVVYGHPKLTYGRHLDQKYAVGLDIFKESGANTVNVADLVLQELKKIENNPEMEGIRIYEMDNQAEGIISSLAELFNSGILGAILATIVLFYFLRRWSTTFVVALAVPLSLLLTLACMFFLDISLNILSMMGLMLAVGMLVDNAVVATESIHRHQQNNGDPKKATLLGVNEISLAITAGTLTTIIVFLPNIVSSNDQVAIWLKYVAISLSIALLASLILAQTIIPLLASKFKHTSKKTKRNSVDRLIESYSRILEWTLIHRKLTTLFIALILFSIAIPATLVKFDMFPDQSNDRKIRLHYNINSNYTVAEVEKTVDLIEDYLYANKKKFEIKSVYSYYQGDYASSTIMLLKGDEADKSQDEIIELIRKDLPKIPIGKPGFEWNQSTSGENGIQIQLIGKSSEELAKLAHDVAWTLEQIPGIVDAQSEDQVGDKEIHVVVDRERSKQYGFSTREVANVVSAAMRGIRLRKFKTHEGELNVKVEFQDTDKQNMESLQNLPLFDNSNRMFTLASLADFYTRRGPQSIRRNDRVSGIRINANVKDITIGEARKKIQEVMDRYKLPPGYSWNYGQRFSYEDDAAMSMLINMLLALALIYLVMAALFESLIFPAGIWSSIIFSVVGVYWFFLMTGTVMSVMALIGILVLIGVVVNNGIVLIDHIIRLRDQGKPRQEAILQAGRERLRPIIMTAATTVFSLVPLTMVTTQIGGGGPPYFPMARAIVGGLTFSTFVTLLILPTIYILLDEFRNWLRKLIQKASPVKASSPIAEAVKD